MMRSIISRLSNTGRALLFILLAALLYSLVPLAIDKLGSSRLPFVVGAGITLGYAIYTEIARRQSTSQHRIT